MDPKELQRAHMERLKKNAKADLGRHQNQKTARQKEREKVSDAMSAAWNKRLKSEAEAKAKAEEPANAPNAGEPLPEGWRDEHWKTLQSMAKDFAGVEVGKKDEAIAALEAYEATLQQSGAE